MRRACPQMVSEMLETENTRRSRNLASRIERGQFAPISITLDHAHFSPRISLNLVRTASVHELIVSGTETSTKPAVDWGHKVA
jgi:hypothetical protein